jgi:UDP-N-acetylmuramate dehydrogenase
MGLERLRLALGDRMLLDEPLSRHTTFGIGGPADGFVVAASASELRECVRLAWSEQVPYLVIGAGANVLVSDKGVRGLVVQNRASAVEIAPEPAGHEPAADGFWLVKAESGAALHQVARQAIERGLGGLEWAVDVPGTVGGAVVGNAGAFGGYVSDNLRGAEVLVPGEEERWRLTSELQLAYRSSMFKQVARNPGFAAVIVSATFALHPEDPSVLRDKAAEYSRRRAETQPQGLSAGSVFKRTAQYPAGFLIENAGLKGARVGGAFVSPTHANFVINDGSATANDVLQLIEHVRSTVNGKFKVALELEVDLVGEW